MDNFYGFDVIRKIDEALGQISEKFPNYRYRIEASLNEEWFSDTLAWVLDPKGSHGLGVDGIKAFVKIVAKERSNPDGKYWQKTRFLKYGSQRPGTPVSKFKLRNVSIVRDLHLSRATGAYPERGRLHCDLVCLDLDNEDSLLIVVENKLWSNNKSEQLSSYYKAVEAKYKKQVDCREYVYLTLEGETPKTDEGDASVGKTWISIGWLSHLHMMLKSLNSVEENQYLARVIEVLDWLSFMRDLSYQQSANSFADLHEIYCQAYEACLEEELNRLTSSGVWEVVSEKGSRKLKHSSHPARRIKVGVQGAGPSIEIQGKIHDKQLFESIILPAGIHPEQTANLIDLAAREIMNSFFVNPPNFKSGVHWQTEKLVGQKELYLPVFCLAYDYPNALRFLLTQ